MEKPKESAKLIKLGLEKYKRAHGGAFSISLFAKKCGLAYSTVYNVLFNERHASADIFLKIMKELESCQDSSRH